MGQGLIPLLYTFFGSKDSMNYLIAGTPTEVSGVGAGTDSGEVVYSQQVNEVFVASTLDSKDEIEDFMT